LELSAAFTRPVKVLLEFTRREKEVLLRGRAETSVSLECGRCLDPMERPLSARVTVEFVPPEEKRPEEDGENAYFVEYSGFDLPVGEELRQELELAVPANPVCMEGCKGLCPVCGANLNQKDCGHRPQEGQGALAKLADLLKEKKGQQ
jgi:uncharacterized protein